MSAQDMFKDMTTGEIKNMLVQSVSRWQEQAFSEEGINQKFKQTVEDLVGGERSRNHDHDLEVYEAIAERKKELGLH